MPQAQDRTFRNWKPKSFDEKSRSCRAVIATEAPTAVYDYFTGRMVNEVLLVSGAILPGNQQIPLIDSHRADTVRNILGSCRNIRVEDGALIGDVFFTDDAGGESVMKKVRDGHLTDLSAGYNVLEYMDLYEGESATIHNRTFTGPLRVTTSWAIKEVSATPIGADENSKFRSEGKNMTTQNTTTTDQTAIDQQRAEAVRMERARVSFITEMCSNRGFNCEELGRRLIADGVTEEQARAAIFDHAERTNPPVGAGRIEVEHPVRRADAITDGLLARAGYTPEKPADGYNDFRHASLVDIARDCLYRNSRENTRGLPHSEIIRRAMTMRTHSTDDFPLILANTANKMLRVAYEGAPSTFEYWTVKGQARDFKQMSRVQLSAAPSLAVVPENAEYTYGSFPETGETFQVVKFGKMFTTSWESLVNDDLDAFGRVAKAFVASAKRGLNANVYQRLIDNAAMSDGENLFSVAHSNIATGGDTAAPSIATLGEARRAMRMQTGLQGEILNVEPVNLLVPASLETVADQIVNTHIGFDSTEGPGVSNPFFKKLNVIAEPVLDGDSLAQWYLTADPRRFDTIEVAYLDGNETPYLEEDWGFEVDAWRVKIRFCYGIGVLDHRGLFCNPGE